MHLAVLLLDFNVKMAQWISYMCKSFFVEMMSAFVFPHCLPDMVFWYLQLKPMKIQKNPMCVFCCFQWFSIENTKKNIGFLLF